MHPSTEIQVNGNGHSIATDAAKVNGVAAELHPSKAKVQIASDDASKAQVEPEYKIRESLMGTKRRVRVIFLGMGAAGIDFVNALKKTTQDVDVTVYEKNHDIGGTWLENRYPGCACDIPSASYQFTWQRNPNWSQYYSGSKEIWQYMKSVSTSNGLEDCVRFNHKVISADWNEEAGLWKITIMRLEDSSVFEDHAEFFINGGGHLNAWKWPNTPGLHNFKGLKMHSANWDGSTDLTNKKVLVIGAGSSAVQIIPTILERVKSLDVVIRSQTWITAGFAPKYAGPDGQNFEYSEETKQRFREDPKLYMAYCKGIESELSTRFRMVVNDSDEAKEARSFSETQMRRKLAARPELIDSLMPKNFNVGCRRPTPGNGFLESLCDDKTTVLTKEIHMVTQNGYVTAEGEHKEVDAIICATGFDTSFRPFFPVHANGRNVQEDFDSGDTVAYLGLGLPEVPNYFHYSGPYGPLGHGSALPMIEAFTKYFLQVIEKVQLEDIKKIQVKRSVAEKFTRHADLYMKRTAWTGPCSSWFKNGDKARKPTLWPGSRLHYLTMLQQPRFEDFEMQYLSSNMFNFMGDGFHVREYDGHDLTWYYGLLDGKDEQPETLPDAVY